MSQGGTAAAVAAKKKQDEANSKIIRQLASLPENRCCFECGQRGPTYVNITEGSFCCSTCSGVLRGLHPPHRVKSISMATFSTEELEKIQSLGNEENRKTWLGLYDGPPPQLSTCDNLQQFLAKKYERKTWYVSKESRGQQEKLFSAAKPANVQPKTPLNVGALWLDESFTDPFSPSPAKPQISEPISMSPPNFYAPPPPIPNGASAPMPRPPPTANGYNFPKMPANQQQAPFSSLMFSPQQQQPQQQPKAAKADPFGDFDSLFGGLTVQPTPSQPIQPMPRSQTIAVPPRPSPAALNSSTPAIPATRPATNQSRYSTLLDFSAPIQPQPSTAPVLNGFSSAPFGQATPVVAPIQQQAPAQAWPNNPFDSLDPFSGAANPFAAGGIQKSSTIAGFPGSAPKCPPRAFDSDFGMPIIDNNPFSPTSACAPSNGFTAFEGVPVSRPAPPDNSWNPFL
ncbi:unnamed protein product, partial [Mesorhabditis spiculigera]